MATDNPRTESRVLPYRRTARRRLHRAATRATSGLAAWWWRVSDRVFTIVVAFFCVLGVYSACVGIVDALTPGERITIRAKEVDQQRIQQGVELYERVKSESGRS